MNTSFEERLIKAVMDEHARRTAEGAAVVPGPVRHSRTRRIATRAAVVSGAAATTVALMLIGGGTTSAYAVNKSADGSVRVTINEFRDAAELEAELAGVGIAAEIDYLPVPQTCQPYRGERADTGGQMKVGTREDGKGIEFEIGKGQIGKGETLVLAISVDPADLTKPPAATAMQIVRGPVAPCEATALPFPSGGPAGESKRDGGSGPTTDIQRRDQHGETRSQQD
ncbi:hypothetical protein SAMN05421505_1513 [Sinosporangium album]|uniref:Uncharacterized protein n=1 Tax=Sinosporangium album TaxID=504805 RepID=A0A1G8KHI3_9ACTN|nr:hypothetical protein [Sinosporangium album]SDI42868.1 hypothetical protein SAMN05421505_1513 [Sinosporangium album]